MMLGMKEESPQRPRVTSEGPPPRTNREQDISHSFTVPNGSQMKSGRLVQPLQFEPRQSINEPSCLTIDKNCLNCSGNANHSLKAFKSTCLIYSQSAIKYKSKDYDVTDLLGLKGNLL